MASDWEKTKKLIDDAVNYMSKKSTLETIGDYNKETIKTRTRLGKGVDKPLGPQTKLNIKDNTKKTRRNLKKKGQLSSKTQPAKANLTRSGEMLDSLESTVNVSKGEVTTTVASNQQRKAKELKELGHNFLSLTKGEFKGLVELLVKGLLKITK